MIEWRYALIFIGRLSQSLLLGGDLEVGFRRSTNISSHVQPFIRQIVQPPNHFPMQISTTTTLNNNVQMPWLGLGVYKSAEGDEALQAIDAAFKAGYRHIDTAKIYNNEKSVGEAVRTSNIPRADIFVTTKLWNTDHGYDNTLRAFDDSLKRLDIDYIDLYLVHFPVRDIRQETWKAMERIAEGGHCKAIGVSNYLHNHLEELLGSCNIVPAVNQLELSPYCFRDRQATVDVCRKNNIRLEAYSPLTRTVKFDDPALVSIANKYGKTPAQILIRWALEEEIVVIPKSSNPTRIQQNADVFDFSITKEDMEKLNGLNENLLVCWDPAKEP